MTPNQTTITPDPDWLAEDRITTGEERAYYGDRCSEGPEHPEYGTDEVAMCREHFTGGRCWTCGAPMTCFGRAPGDYICEGIQQADPESARRHAQNPYARLEHLINTSTGGKPAMVVLIAADHGWDGRDAEEPEVDILALARRDLAGETLTAEEADGLAFRFILSAEDWLNRNAAPAGYQYGWHGDRFHLATDAWWDAHGGKDQMWL